MEDRKLFDQILPLVFHVEGGFCDLDGDPGGPTNHGVAWNYNAGYLKTHFGMEHPSDIKDLTLEQAKQLYWDKYWLASGCNGITDEGLVYLHFDTAVNLGVGAANQLIHKLSTNPFNFDGTGDKNETLFLRLCMEYMVLRLDYYTHCKNRKAFLEGWVNRMEFVMSKARQLV